MQVLLMLDLKGQVENHMIAYAVAFAFALTGKGRRLGTF
jgi:hypothetical protein